MFEEKIWVVDESKLYPHLIKALEESKAVIHDGVAYWAEGSGNTGVIQHLPFKETAMESVEELLKAAQATTVIATAVSTGIILAAIVVQTRYLAAKLDKIQETVDVIAKDVHAQNIVFYMDKITEYIGQVDVARTLLKDRTLVDEIRDLAIPLLTALAGKRNQILSFVDNVLGLARTSSHITPKHFELIANFAQMMLDMMPLGIHVEYLLCARVGKLRFAEQLLIDGADRYNVALEEYRGFMNSLHRDLVRGQLGDRATVYQSIETKALQLIKSDENKILLSLPTGRVAPLLKAA